MGHFSVYLSRKLACGRFTPYASTMVFVVFACLAIVAVDLWRSWSAREALLQSSQISSVNLTRSVAQHADDTFNLADTALIGLVERLETDGTSPKALTRLHKMMVIRTATSRVRTIFAYDANGTWIANSLIRPPPTFSVAGQDYFQYHRSHADMGVHIGRPVRSWDDGAWIIPVTRRYNRPDGSFGGVVMVGVDLGYFQNFFNTFEVGNQGVMGLFDTDRTILVRRPYVEANIGRRLASGLLFQTYLPRAPSGSYIGPSAIDGVVRQISYRRSTIYPIIAFVALSRDEVLAPWVADARDDLFYTAILALVIGFLGLRLARQIQERQRAGQVLRAKDAQYRLLAENSPDLIIRLDLDGVRRYLSPAARHVLGYAPEELVGTRPLDQIHPDDRDHVAAAYAAIRQGLDRTIVTNRIRHRDGHWLWVEVHLSLLRDLETGAPMEIMCSMRDISQSRKDQEALRDQEASLRALFERTSDTLIVHKVLPGDRFPILRLNDAGAAELRVSPEEAVGKNIADLLPPDQAANYLADITRCRDEKGLVRVEVFADKLPGKTNTYFEIIFVPMIEIDGKVDQILMSARDITHIKQAENELREANRMLRLAEQVGRLGHWRLEVKTGKVTWSPEIYRIYGLDPQDGPPDVAKAIAAYHAEDRPVIERHVRDALEHGMDYEDTLRLVRADGDVRHLFTRAICETDAAGAVTAVFGVSFDVTELKRQERALQEAKEAAEAMSRAKSDFLSTMSHELRTPLTGVLGMIDLLKADPSPGDLRILLDTLKLSAETLLTTVGDILDFSKIDSGRLVLEKTPFAVGDVVRHVIELFSNAASKNGLVMYWADETDVDGATVLGDPVRLRQVLSNLVSNAIKFTAHGEIRLRLRAPAETDTLWRFEVSDTGIGIDPQTRDNLFDAFSQADASITRRYGGSGLGLAISKRIIAAMGGTIGVDSTPGRGSVFWFEVPLEPAETTVANGTGAALDPFRPTDTPLNILVAEDNPVNQMLITTMLRNMGHRTECVENGSLAVERVAAGGFDMVLMDIQMPEMDGATATRLIRAMAGPVRDIPIVALTADALQEHSELYRQAGLTDFLTKPVDMPRLRHILDAIGAMGAITPAASMAAVPAGFDFLKAQRLDDLERAVGREMTVRLLRSLFHDTAARIAELRLAVAGDDREGVARIAHAISGAAANIGAVRLSLVASDLRRAAGEGAPFRDLINELDGVLNETERASAAMGAQSR